MCWANGKMQVALRSAKGSCFDCESNTGPSDLQSDALPTEIVALSRRCKTYELIFSKVFVSKIKVLAPGGRTNITDYYVQNCSLHENKRDNDSILKSFEST